MRVDRRLGVLPCTALLAGCVLGQGVAPYPRDDVAVTREDESIAIEVLANDRGADEVTRFATPPALGTVEVRSDGTVLYTPEPEVSGDDAFSYIVENEHGSAAARVTVHIAVDSERFGEPSTLLAHDRALEPFAADFDRDGEADLVVQAGDQTLAMLADGEGFREVQRWGKPECCLGLAPLLADLDLDGDTDVVRFDERGGLTIHLVEAAEPGGAIAIEDHALAYHGADALAIEGVTVLSGSIPGVVASGDFDGDRAIDLAVGLRGVVPLVVLHSDVSRGTPARSRLLADTPAMSMTSGDVTGDGRADLVLQPGAALDVVTFEGDDVSIVRVGLPSSLAPESTQVLIGQLDDDAREELVLIDGRTLAVLDLRMAGGKIAVESVTLESELRRAVLADVVGDGRLDLVGARWRAPAVEIWRADRLDGKSSFEPYADFLLLGLSYGAPAVLHFGERDRVVAGRFNEDLEEHELVMFPGQER